MSNSYIPDEISNEILLNLHPTSVCRFKCVNKTWRILLSSKVFVDDHLKRMKRESCFGFIHKERVSVPSVRYLPRTFNDQNNNLFVTDDADGFEVLRSFNGLVLTCTTNDQYFLSNPCTSISFIIPPVPKNFFTVRSEEFVYFALGYDDLSDDFIIMRIFRFFQLEGYIFIPMLFSRNNVSWFSLPPFPKLNPPTDNGYFVGGLFHWLVCEHYYDHSLVTFNFRDNTYGDIPIPRFFLESFVCSVEVLDEYTIVVYKSKLTSDEGGVSKFSFEMHVLTYSLSGPTWSNLTIFKEGFLPHPFDIHPIAYMNEEKSVVIFSVKPYGRFYVYDIKSKIFNVQVGIESYPGCQRSYNYIESLVSPYPTINM